MDVLIKDGASIIADRKEKGLDIRDEVHHGVYVVMNIPASRHQRVVDEVQHWFRQRGIARVPGVNVGVPMNFRGPDVAAWFDGFDDAVWFGHETSPDVVVEVISPSNSAEEMMERKNHFEEFGVSVYVEIAEDGSVTVEAFGELDESQSIIIDELGAASFDL